MPGRFGVHPAMTVTSLFALAIAVSSAMLLLPWSRAGAGGATPMAAVFTSTSAVCVTGHAVVDTATYWSPFGQVVIMLSIQLGGLGIQAAGALLSLLVSRRLGLRQRLVTQVDIGTVNVSDVRLVLMRVVQLAIIVESVIFVILTLRFWTTYDNSLGRSVWYGLFHAVSAYNNAGFALFSDSAMRFVGDPVIIGCLGGGTIMGAIGVPVVYELVRERRPRRWSLHTKITLVMTGLLLAIGFVAILVLEWNHSMRGLNAGERVLGAFFQSVVPRTSGFNSIDIAQYSSESLLVTDVLMFIGGASGSTAGGIKVTTFAVLFFVILAEVKGETEVNAFRRRIGADVIRQATTVALLAVAWVIAGSAVLVGMSPTLGLDRALFETISAFGTVGMSTGVVPGLPAVSQIVLIILMFVGRLGPVTLATALALRNRSSSNKIVYSEGRPLVG
jgi:potassium uptake TrkH family protein